MGLELVAGIGQCLIAFIFIFLYINTKDTKNWCSWLFLALGLSFILTAIHSIYVLSVENAYTGIAVLQKFHDGWFMILIPTIIVVMFFMIYEIFLKEWMQKRLAGDDSEDDD